RSTIIEFAKKNYDVVINYCHSEADSNELKEFVEKEYNVSALVIKASVSNESEVEAMVEQVIEVFGHIDVLVNNAGILEQGLKPIDRFLDEDMDRIIETNEKGT
ncbi:MAG: SDR family NAD(P)-dependent oxidoreductase, partial [Coprococcus comes]|nr:SDR family NAD(P)-dependent oxidoreductase [Coprococcus comes]